MLSRSLNWDKYNSIIPLKKMMPEFSQFAALPAEIQMNIWSHAVLAYPARIVELRNSRYQGRAQLPRLPYGSRIGKVRPGTMWADTSLARVPAVLHASSDARKIALKRWTRIFGSTSQTSVPGPGKVFFDVAADILFFGAWFDSMHHFVTVTCPDVAIRKRIQAIAFSPYAEETRAEQPLDLDWITSPEGVAMRMQRDFPGLRTLYLVWNRRLKDDEADHETATLGSLSYFPHSPTAWWNGPNRDFNEDPQATEIRFFLTEDSTFHDKFYMQWATNRKSWLTRFNEGWANCIHTAIQKGVVPLPPPPTVVDVDYTYYRPRQIADEGVVLKTRGRSIA